MRCSQGSHDAVVRRQLGLQSSEGPTWTGSLPQLLCGAASMSSQRDDWLSFEQKTGQLVQFF